MTLVADIVRRFGIALMLVAIVSLVSQASAAYAYGDVGGCADEAHSSHSVDHGRQAAVHLDRGDVDHVQRPCKAACCHAACSLALLADQAAVRAPRFRSRIDHSSFVRGSDGIDTDGPARPPRAPLSV